MQPYIILQHIYDILSIKIVVYYLRGRDGHDRMVFGFTTTSEISAYHH